MKKVSLFVTLCLMLIISCSEEQNETIPIEAEKLETINYTFNGEKITVQYLINEENDDLIAIDNEASALLESIYDENETLIQFYLDDNNVMLFSDDNGLNQYLENIGRPLQTKNNSLTAASASPYQEENLELYYDCCYDSRKEIRWDFSSLPSSCGSVRAFGEERLRDFTNQNLWKSTISGPLICISNPGINNNPDNRLNSVFVKNVFARFYEHPNYGGRTIVRDARNGGESGFRKLRRVRHRGKWNNRISSIKLSF